jgi:hypothetical protein
MVHALNQALSDTGVKRLFGWNDGRETGARCPSGATRVGLNEHEALMLRAHLDGLCLRQYE